MYLSWTIPPNTESLLGVLIADNVDLTTETGERLEASLLSIGVLFFRIDILMNKQIIEE